MDNIIKIKSYLADKYINKKDAVLDFGCGKGVFLSYLKGKNKELYGYDVVKNYKKEVSKYGKFITNIKRFNKKINVLTLFEVIEHLDNKAMDEVFRIIKNNLKKEGLVMITTPNINNIYVLRDFWNDPSHIRPYTIEATERLFPNMKVVEKGYCTPSHNPAKYIVNLLFGMNNYYGIYVVLKKTK